MKNIVFLEGMPLVGKTYILNKIKENNQEIKVVDELLLNVYINQDSFMENDILKIRKYNDGKIVIDRGLISTLSYNEVKKLIDKNFDEYEKVLNWFNKYKYIYEEDFVKTIYLKKNNYQLRYVDELDPYGSVDNQKKLEEVTINNIKKYCKKYKIKNYSHNCIDEVINEVIS